MLEIWWVQELFGTCCVTLWCFKAHICSVLNCCAVFCRRVKREAGESSGPTFTQTFRRRASDVWQQAGTFKIDKKGTGSPLGAEENRRGSSEENRRGSLLDDDGISKT